MFYYIDTNENLVKSSVELGSELLRPLTEEEYLTELQRRFEEVEQ